MNRCASCLNRHAACGWRLRVFTARQTQAALVESPRLRELLALNEILHDVQDFVVDEITLEFVSLRVRSLRRKQAIDTLVDFLGLILGELLPQFGFVQRDGLAGTPGLEKLDLLG